MRISFPAIKAHSSFKHGLSTAFQIQTNPMMGTSQGDVVAFKAKSVRSTPLLEDFTFKLKQSGMTAEKLANSATRQENLRGEGRCSKVYNIPHEAFYNYVIKVYKDKKFMNEVRINDMPKMNLGQPIYKISDTTLVLKKLGGEEHSIPNWSDKNSTYIPSREEAGQFLSNLQRINSMPEETFVDFAERIKYAAQYDYKTDSINPNNLLIDYENQKISFVDYWLNDKARYGKPKDWQVDCYMDMVTPLLDFVMFKRYYDALDGTQQKQFIETSNSIVQKCYSAAEKVGLPTDKKYFAGAKMFADKVSKYCVEGNPEYYTAHYMNGIGAMLNLP